MTPQPCPVQWDPFLSYNTGYPDKHLVLSGESFQRMQNFLERSPAIAFDFETSGVEWFKHSCACGIAFAGWDSTDNLIHNFYVPFRHRTGERQLDISMVGPGIKQILENDKLKLAQHLKFDEHMARREGWKVRGPRYDTMIAARLFDENRRIALKYRAATDLGRQDADVWETKVEQKVLQNSRNLNMYVADYRNQYGYSQVHIPLAGTYACFDVDFTTNLYWKYENLGLSRKFQRIWDTEMRLTEVLCDMEEFGLPIDVEYLERLRATLRQVQKELEAKIWYQLNRRSFNLNADEELRNFLMRDLGLRLTKKTKGGAYSVDRDVLDSFADQFPVLKDIGEWRDAEKLASTYTNSILQRLDANNILHPDFDQVGTNTGRFSARNPNFQNQPTDDNDRAIKFSGKSLEDGGIDPWSIRRAYLNRGSGWVRLFFDYSQIELRVLAHYSQDPIMVKAFLEGEDIHSRTSLEVFGTQEKARRRLAKVINFGLSYGMTEKGFSYQAKIPEAEASAFLKTFFERYQGVSRFRWIFWNHIRANGKQFRNLFGRPRRLEDIDSKNSYERGRAERQAIATLIQGTAADIMKESLVRLWEWFQAEKLPAYLVSTIHDEAQADCHTDVLEQVAKGMKQRMEDYPEFAPIPIIADGDYTVTNWAEKKALPI